MKYDVFVITAGRWNELPFTQEQKSRFIFCVRNGEKAEYESVGCREVFETGNLIHSRNWALEHAFKQNKICVQLSDDLKKIKLNENFFNKQDVCLDDALEDMIDFFKDTPIKIMGVPPTSNSFFAKEIISMNTFCIGDCLFVKPTELRFDEKLTLKEDYDYTLQHWKKYGISMRYQKYLFHFKHYDNKGGVVSYRNKEEEQKNINYLFKKWGTNNLKLNNERENEILIRWKK